MHAIIAGATGLIGRKLVNFWLKNSHKITVIGRTKAHIVETFGEAVTPITWSEVNVDLLKSADLIVNLAGANIGEKHWTVTRKQEILNSRINVTKIIADLLAEIGKNAPPLFNASAIGVYGLQTQSDALPPPLNEETQINWNEYPDFLAEVGRKWEQAAKPAVDAGCRVIFLRFGVVLAKEGGALPELVKPLRMFIGGKIGTGNQPFSWVAIDDVIGAIEFLRTTKNANGAYNIVAPECVSQKTFAAAVSHAVNKPVYISLPAIVFKLLLGKEMARELLFEGQHVYPKKILELGYQFKYPEVSIALSHILS